MARNVNLLDELSIYPVSGYNCKLMLRVTCGWILLLALIYAVAIDIHSSQKKTLSELKATQKNATGKITTYKQELATFEPSYMHGISPNSSSLLGFYRHLEALAKFTPRGVWLKEMSFSEPDGAVTLKGSTIVASGVSILLNSLSKSQSLSDKKFSTFLLQKSVELDHTTDFTINTVTTSDTEPDKKL